VESFRNRTGIYPFVLTGDAAPWRPLRDALGAALKRNGLGGAVHVEDDFKPHVTLLRDDTRVKPLAVEPITWMVRDFVLVHSLLGQTKHVHIGRWALNA
jgi:2'-5' RNA ligase